MARPSEPDTPPGASTAAGPERFLNRELSWMAFNARVLAEAQNAQHPLLERVKFLAIFSSNLDEFFMVRVSGLRELLAEAPQRQSPDGRTPGEQLAAIRALALEQFAAQRRCWHEELRPALREAGIHVLDYAELDPAQRAAGAQFFADEVFPVLTPLAVDPSRPFPHISNLSLNLAVIVRDDEHGERFARVKVPATLPRLVPIPAASDAAGPGEAAPAAFVWLDQLIGAHLGQLFPGQAIVAHHAFRVTRDADVEIAEDDADNLLQMIAESVRERRFGAVVRLSVVPEMPERLRDLLQANLQSDADAVYVLPAPLGMAGAMGLTKLDRPDLKDPPFTPRLPAPLRRLRTGGELFDAIRAQDILLHHPYDSFQPVVDLIAAAATDPHVLAIKQTLYRVGNDSPIVAALMRAREQDKQVTVLLELKARFDEENNMGWARALEDAGVHVVYGLIGLKTHAKLALVVRRDPDGLRRYVHLGTGNYNVSTARLYTDMGLLTCRPEIGADVSDLFNVLTGYAVQDHYRELLVAPGQLRRQLRALIEREVTHAQAGRGGRIAIKCNALVDTAMIDELYRAAQAGVRVDLIIRSACMLRPEVPGLSEGIAVRSVVGRFLEHTRIYWFENGGEPTVYLGSADLMPRNLDRRVETLFPLHDRRLVDAVRSVVDLQLADTARAWLLQPDGVYVRPAADGEPCDSQAALLAEGDGA